MSVSIRSYCRFQNIQHISKARGDSPRVYILYNYIYHNVLCHFLSLVCCKGVRISVRMSSMETRLNRALSDAEAAGQFLAVGIEGTRLSDDLRRGLSRVSPGAIIL